MGILGPLLGLINFILGRTDRWQDNSAERRNRVAAYLQAISDCLGKVAADLRAKKHTYFACSELAHYALRLPDAVQSELGEEGRPLLEALRDAASDRGELYQRVEDTDEVQRKLALMEETAGRIKAIAVSLVVS